MAMQPSGQMHASIAEAKAAGSGSGSCYSGAPSDVSTGSSTDSSSLPAARPQPAPQPTAAAAAAATVPARQPSSHQLQEQACSGLRALEHSLTSEGPARDLADVSHRLKKLEKAVKAHLLAGPRVPGDVSILASAAGGSSILSLAGAQQQGGCSPLSGPAAGSPSPAGARLSERSRLRETLSGIKSDVADLAVRQVEAQLLQQRVLRLEAAIGSFGGLGTLVGPAGMASGFTSCAGSIIAPAGAAAAGGAGSNRAEATPRLTRNPSGDLGKHSCGL